MDMVEIGASIRDARKALGMTQAQVANPLGITQATLSLIESGQIEEVGIRKVLRVMDQVGLMLTAKPLQHGYTLEDAQTEKKTLNDLGSNAGLEGTPPSCWYIDFGRYGQISMRQDEAQRAADDGATVWQYTLGTIMPSIRNSENTQKI